MQQTVPYFFDATNNSTLLGAEAGVDAVVVLLAPEHLHTARRTQDAELCTRGFLAIEHLPPQMMHNLDVARLQRYAPRMKHHQIGILEKPHEIHFGGHVESNEGVCCHPVPGSLMLSCLSSQDVTDKPAI